jgi:hypothetical protein
VQAQWIRIGDPVLTRHDGNLIPGVVAEVKNETFLVKLAEPYVEQNGETTDEVWAGANDVTRILDDSDALPEFPPA